MSESLSEVANRARSTETLDPLARTDGRSGRTDEAVTQVEMDPSPNASRAGGLKESIVIRFSSCSLAATLAVSA